MSGYGSSLMKPKGRVMGWLRHVLTVLSVAIFLLGCMVLGYLAWVLATSVTVARFLDGQMYWTYSVITLGFSLFFSGLLGLFLIFIVFSMLAEIGGIITLNIFGQGFSDILERGWMEVNQGTRNIVQDTLSCCGWRGLDEFKNNEIIDESCYERVTPGGVSGILSGLDEEEEAAVATRRMKQEPCATNLESWFLSNKITWVTMLATIAAVQVMCLGIAVYILQRVSKLRKGRGGAPSSGKRLMYAASDSGEDRRHMGRI